jgi:hypothetical protein
MHRPRLIWSCSLAAKICSCPENPFPVYPVCPVSMGVVTAGKGEGLSNSVEFPWFCLSVQFVRYCKYFCPLVSSSLVLSCTCDCRGEL